MFVVSLVSPYIFMWKHSHSSPLWSFVKPHDIYWWNWWINSLTCDQNHDKLNQDAVHGKNERITTCLLWAWCFNIQRHYVLYCIAMGHCSVPMSQSKGEGGLLHVCVTEPGQISEIVHWTDILSVWKTSAVLRGKWCSLWNICGSLCEALLSHGEYKMSKLVYLPVVIHLTFTCHVQLCWSRSLSELNHRWYLTLITEQTRWNVY